MTESVGKNASDGSRENAPIESGAVHTLAQVLEQEFRDLHESDLLKQTHAPFGQDSTPVTEAKQQQPLADPSLAPADNRAHDHIEKPEDGSTSSQQPDIDPEAAALRKLWDRVHSLAGDGRTALCLSGGGVRSAAFNLGVLQGLARLELLDRFHYLSTVSGGGYIGCWLSAWRHRCERGISDVLEGLSWPDRIRDRKVSPRVPEAISNLRRGTSYLTPAKGILSPDTWATIVIVSRNLLLNHLVIVPLIAAVLLIVKLFGATASHDWLFTPWENWIRSWTRSWSELWFKTEYVGSLLLTGALVTFGWITFSIARPSWDVRRPSPAINTVSLPRYHESFAQVWAPRLGILLVLTGALTFALMAANDIPRGQSSWTWEQFAAFPIAGAGGALLAFVVALGVASLKRALCKSPRSGDPHRMALGLRLRGAYEWGVRVLGVVPEVPPGPVTVPTAGARAVILLALAALVAGGAGGLVLGAGEEAAAYLPNTPWSTSLVLSIAPLWLVLSYDVGDAVYLGLTVRRPRLRAGLEWSDSWGDEEREWVARTGGYLTVITLGISILCLLTLFGAELIKFVMSFPWTGPVGLAILAILSALASIGLAASPFSTQFGTAPKGVRLPVRTILAIATPIFAALLIVLLSAALDLVLFKKPLLDLLSQEVRVDSLWFDPRTISGHVGLLGSALFLALFSRIAAGFVNINRFSLYDLYRMRLTREFLGASNRTRRPDFWTGFDETDDIPLADLWPFRGDNKKRLYPVINAALNMAATKKLEWQERKAVSFVFTPRNCGSGATPDLGFRDTAQYANGIELGWTMSVSGAAFSPNAGYSTMPGLALLMTLFNLRLGAWSGNPGKAGGASGRYNIESFRQRGPHNAWLPLITEAFALTDDQRKYVYLSDGGHFDNLGVYEMLRRRCRFIVISDATCDPDYVYADLGSVVRKAAIDFGIRIRFKHLDMARRGDAIVKSAYSAFAVIEYPEVQFTGRRERGYLLYIKAYYGGLEEPADVRAYALANPAFPHDTTLNQFFGEAQFESYRALGSFTVVELGRQAGFDSASMTTRPNNLAQFFRGARKGFARSRATRSP